MQRSMFHDHTLSGQMGCVLLSCALTAHRLPSSQRTNMASLLVKKMLMMRDFCQRECFSTDCSSPSLCK